MPAEKKFKVCLVAISLAKGGLERSCAMLSQMLESQGHHVHLVLLNDALDYPYSGKIFNLGKFKNKKDSFFKRILRFKKFRNYLNEHHFDVIIDHRPKNSLARELFYSFYLYLGIQKIYVAHSSHKDSYLTESPKIFAQICKRNLHNVAVSEYIEKEIFKKEGIENTATIHNAYNPQWNDTSGVLPKVLANKKYMLSYGRLDDEIKDFSFLIQAFAASQLWEEEIYLVILGDGRDKEKLQKLAASTSCCEYILFFAFTSNPFEIIKHAHCVTLTSKYEGFPMVLVESLSLGTPVVSLNIISGPSEIIENGINGLLVSERKLSLFVGALQKICADNILYTNLKQNTKPSVMQFSMENISKKWNKLLQDEL